MGVATVDDFDYKTTCYILVGVGAFTMLLVHSVAGSLILVASSIFAVADSILNKK